MIFQFVLHFFVFLLATVITQIGGMAYVGALALRRYGPTRYKSKFVYPVFLFLVLYSCLWILSLFVAPEFGRVALPCRATKSTLITVQSPLYCILNRQYVTPKLLRAGNALAAFMHAKHPGTQTLALDANFPFFDEFPLLPHLSHDDGRKLDIAFYYENRDGEYVVGETRSPIGYWGFEQPLPGSSQPCSRGGNGMNLRWDMDWFGVFLNDNKLDDARTATTLLWLSTQGRKYGVSKVFVEPHLAQRLTVSGDTIRFQGCRAARHDDHIHFEISR